MITAADIRYLRGLQKRIERLRNLPPLPFLDNKTYNALRILKREDGTKLKRRLDRIERDEKTNKLSC